jgi:integrase
LIYFGALSIILSIGASHRLSAVARGNDQTGRSRGSIRERGGSLQVRVFAGFDPVTGKRRYLARTIRGTDRAAYRLAEKALTKLQAQVDKQRAPESSISLSYALDEWLAGNEIEDTTRRTYTGYIERTIKPALGAVPIDKLGARDLERLYQQLRRCRALCDGKPFVEHGPPDADHDCARSKCRPHQCRPMAASTIRQIHSIISGTLAAAVRWEWLGTNPARAARRPRAKAPEPRPPSSVMAAQLIDAAFEMDDDWGTLVWLVMTTGLRRGEVCALRWQDLDLDGEIIDIRRNYVLHKGVGTEKDTKTHQMRRIALDSETTAILRAHRSSVSERLQELGQTLTDERYVFTGTRTPDHSEPYSPHAVSSRYRAMADRLGIKTHLHALRHYSATELLTAGVDLRTVAGRLGHGGGGATTLRVYAAWVAASDRKAAEILGSRMPRRRI